MDKDITELFCLVDDFCKAIEENFADKLLANPNYGLASKERHKNRGLFRLHGIGNQNRKNMN